MSFTIQNVISGITSIFLMALLIFVPSILFNNCDPKTVDNVKTCQILILNSGIVGSFLGLVGLIFGVFVPFFLSIKPKDIRDQLQDERGPTHGTLPKGFDNNAQRLDK